MGADRLSRAWQESLKVSVVVTNAPVSDGEQQLHPPLSISSSTRSRDSYWQCAIVAFGVLFESEFELTAEKEEKKRGNQQEDGLHG